MEIKYIGEDVTSLSGKSDLEILDTIEREFGSTDTPILWSTFILPNGKFLKLESDDIDDGEHSLAYDWLSEHKVYGIPDVFERNCFKINVNFPYISCPINRPTSAQFRALEYWLVEYNLQPRKAFSHYIEDEFEDASDDSILILSGDGKDETIYDLNDFDERNLVRRIQKFYSSGVFEEYKMNNMLTEAKADQEKFRQWIYDNLVSGKKYSDVSAKNYADQYVELFNKFKQSLKSPESDLYYWMKQDFDKFLNLIQTGLQKTQDRKDKSEKEKEGARLLYSDNSWKIYEITNYEASAKYGKGTKWCISGSKVWNSEGDGKTYFETYQENGIKFYFLIGNGTKYAIAKYKNGKAEIYNAEDVRIAYIPNAPIVDEIGINYTNASFENRLMEAISTCSFSTSTFSKIFTEVMMDYTDGYGDCILYGNDEIQDVISVIDDHIPDGYLEFEAIHSDYYYDEEELEKAISEFKDEFGFDPVEDSSWGGDLPSINLPYELSRVDYSTKSIFNTSNPFYTKNKFFLIVEDSYEQEYDLDGFEDWMEVLNSLNFKLIGDESEEDFIDDDEDIVTQYVVAESASTIVSMLQNGKLAIKEIANGKSGITEEELSAFINNKVGGNDSMSNLEEKLSPAGYEPKKKGIAYKVFKVKNGKLYPPMVANANNEDTPIGVWLDAEEGEFAGLSKTGRPQVKSTGSGNLSYRPGWHLGDIPRASQFDRKNKETGEMEFPKDFVWAECEYAMDVDYQPESDARGYERTKLDNDGNVITYKSDKYQHSLAGVPHLPTNGYYKYRTNPNPETVPWVITGQMKVNKLLSDDEVNKILKSKGIKPIHRQGGDKTLKELGLVESLKEFYYPINDTDDMFLTDDLYRIKALFNSYESYRCCYEINENVVGFCNIMNDIHDKIESNMLQYTDDTTDLSKLKICRFITFDKHSYDENDIDDELDYWDMELTQYEYEKFFLVWLEDDYDFETTELYSVLGKPIKSLKFTKFSDLDECMRKLIESRLEPEEKRVITIDNLKEWASAKGLLHQNFSTSLKGPLLVLPDGSIIECTVDKKDRSWDYHSKFIGRFLYDYGLDDCNEFDALEYIEEELGVATLNDGQTSRPEERCKIVCDKTPTNAQAWVIGQWVDYWTNDDDVTTLTVFANNCYQEYDAFDYDGGEIVRKIRRAFVTNMLEESLDVPWKDKLEKALRIKFGYENNPCKRCFLTRDGKFIPTPMSKPGDFGLDKSIESPHYTIDNYLLKFQEFNDYHMSEDEQYEFLTSSEITDADVREICEGIDSVNGFDRIGSENGGSELLEEHLGWIRLNGGVAGERYVVIPSHTSYGGQFRNLTDIQYTKLVEWLEEFYKDTIRVMDSAGYAESGFRRPLPEAAVIFVIDDYYKTGDLDYSPSQFKRKYLESKNSKRGK